MKNCPKCGEPCKAKWYNPAPGTNTEEYLQYNCQCGYCWNTPTLDKEQHVATVTKIPTEEEKAKSELEGEDGTKPIEEWIEPPQEWIGTRERAFLESSRTPGAAKKTDQ